MAQSSRKRRTDPVTAYAKAVVANKIIAGKLVRLACERHLRDLKNGAERGLKFDRDAAQRKIDFFPAVLKHSKGHLAGQPFHLLSWQQFVIGSIFGWKMKIDYEDPLLKRQLPVLWVRRFRTAFVSTARKNGKSTLEAGIGLAMLIDENEHGGEVYSAATTRDQAKIVFSEAERMVASSPALRRRIESTTNNLAVIGTASWFRPLSADASKMDGLNVFCALVDEVHEHPNSGVIDKLDTGMGARQQPLLYETTTAGVDRESICYQHWDFSAKVLEGLIPVEVADRWFAYIATIDEDDDWQDELSWAKANPSLGGLLKLADLRADIALAKAMPGKQNAIRRLRLNQWTQQVTRAIDMEVWQACVQPFDLAELRGRDCYGGLDLARVNDLTSLCLVFPPKHAEEKWKALWFHWVPEQDIIKRSERDRAPYTVWRDHGKLTATPGNTTDFDFVKKQIVNLGSEYGFNVLNLAYDRTFAGEIIQYLQDEGVPLVEFGQGFISMGPAWAEMMRKLIGGMLQFDDPVANWAASNVTTRTDPAGNEKPDKERSTERIDPIVALIMAIGISIVPSEKPKTYQLMFVGGGAGEQQGSEASQQQPVGSAAQ